ncbi:MAG: MotA/TolQ/ExbB proton channel family protein [Pseudomonadales bacterium]
MLEFLSELSAWIIQLLWSDNQSTQMSIGIVVFAGCLVSILVYFPLLIHLIRLGFTKRSLTKLFSLSQNDEGEHRDKVVEVLKNSLLARHIDDFYMRWSNSKNNLDSAPVRFASTFDAYPLLRTGWRRSLLPSIPGIFLALGILGTFVGLTLALDDTPTGSTDEIGQQISVLTAALSLAFRTSLWGILLSILFVVVIRWLEGSYESLEEEIDKLVHKAFLWTSEAEIAAEAVRAQVSGTGQLKSALQEVAESLENALTAGLDKIEQSTSSAANVVSQELIEQLGTTLQEGVGAHVEELRRAIEETTKVQEEIGVSLALTFEEIRKATEAHGLTADSLDGAATAVNAAANKLSVTAEEFAPAVEHLASTSESLKSTASSMEKVQESTASAIASVRDTLDQARASLDEQRDLVEKTMAEMQSAIQRLSEGLSDDLIGALKSIDGVLGGAVGRLSGTIHDSNETLAQIAPVVANVLTVSEAISSSSESLGPQIREVVSSLKASIEPLRDSIQKLSESNLAMSDELKTQLSPPPAHESPRSAAPPEANSSDAFAAQIHELSKSVALLAQRLKTNTQVRQPPTSPSKSAKRSGGTGGSSDELAESSSRAAITDGDANEVSKRSWWQRK